MVCGSPLQGPRRSLAAAFRDAARGLGRWLADEPHARLFAALAGMAICAGAAMRISAAEWASVFAAIGLVGVAEAVNTALEDMADAVYPDPHPGIGRAKDIAAGAVLLAIACAIVIGVLVYGRRFAALVWGD